MKGWWREETSQLVAGKPCASSTVGPSFPRLRKLVLRRCPNLKVFPSCPKLISLELSKCHEALTLCKITSVLYLEKLKIDNVGSLECLFGDLLGSVHELSIEGFKGETFLNFAAVVRIAFSIKKLTISYCKNLKSVSGVVEHLTNLQNLTVTYCENLELVTMASCISPSYLRLEGLPQLLNLPKGFKCLTSLEYLKIEDCDNLEALPEWFSCLASLQTLSFEGCDKLKLLPEAIAHMPSLKTLDLGGSDEDLMKRCREPDGEDWPKICRIPNILV